ncbi:MAG TPA: hypothetical protein VK633_13315 [Verrucomicrobiae bacterium]|nr:hypothetical protein [Verrucomicrobiae bacterium]
MKTTALRGRFFLLGLILAAFTFAGCSSTKPGRAKAHTISISLDPSLQGQRVLVDLVAVNPSQKRQWEEKSMTEYWGASDDLRASARKVTMELSQADKPQTFSVKDPLWKEWLSVGASDVFVLADIPNLGRKDDKPAEADARRRILPLDPKRWESGTQELRVVVKRGGLEVVSRQRAR